MWGSYRITRAVTVCESAGRLSNGSDNRRRAAVRFQTRPGQYNAVQELERLNNVTG